MGGEHIAWANTCFWDEEKRMVMDALESGWLSGGDYVDKFEAELSRYCGSRYALTTSNGTSALHLAFLAAGICRGDEVILPGFGFMAAANILLHIGAIPVFADVDPLSWCVSVDEIEKKITRKTKAIVPVHTYGNVCPMDEINRLAVSCGLIVVEDAAEAIGSKGGGRYAGTMAEIGCFSFHATKTITSGEGGAVVTNDPELIRSMQLYRNHGMGKKKYWHEVAGHNFRLSNLLAALGYAQLRSVEKISTSRSRIYQLYRERLSENKGVTLQYFPDDVEPIVWAVAVRLHPEAYKQGRNEVMKQFANLQIETRPGFCAASEMDHLYGKAHLPVASKLSRQILSLPSSPGLSDEQIHYICDCLLSLKQSS